MYSYQGQQTDKLRSWRRPRTRLRGEVFMKPISTAKLKDRREKEGFTQRDLASLCKCTQAAISALECGTMTQCSEDLATQISKWLRRDVDELFVKNVETRVPRMTNAAGSKRQLVNA
jgi:transcriptional regulator with XRE-family HTH domain